VDDAIDAHRVSIKPGWGHLSRTHIINFESPIATNHGTFSFQQNGDSLFDSVKLPRIAEYLIANSIQPPGRDLFRFTNALETLY
jgi:hypothetical protein